MPLVGKKLENVNLEDLKALINEREREGKYLEYKKTLPGKSDPDKIEFCYDITALANSDGGDIIYGISDKKDRKDLNTAIPDKIIGLSGINEDHVQNRLINIVQSNITPQFYGLRFHWIPISDDKKILIIRIPRSWQKPHAVRNNHDIRVYVRTQSGKMPVDFEEIKRMVLLSGTHVERLRSFRDERITALSKNKIGFTANPTAVLIHFIPIVSLESTFMWDAEFLFRKADEASLYPIAALNKLTFEYNVDGVISVDKGEAVKPSAFIQIFRNGIIETCNNNMIVASGDGTKELIASAFLDGIYTLCTRAISFYKIINISPPFIFFMTVFNTNGVHIRSNKSSYNKYDVKPIEENKLLLPEVIFSDFNVDVWKALKPNFDILWNAANIPHCLEYES
ncbi:MAG: ATP-binding protein [candidate division Zixibacteria bacterium]